MGRQKLTGPVTRYVASALAAERSRRGVTYDSLVESSGLSKGAVVGALTGTRSIAIEAFVAICEALDVDSGELLDAAAEVARPPEVDLAADNPGTPTDRERMEAEWGDDPA
ncbi:helix-turn-helix domain-containing protein [Cutibacterium porci]|nr:helix-turn-helix transcriptional regulator [Cutibacterium porci]